MSKQKAKNRVSKELKETLDKSEFKPIENPIKKFFRKMKGGKKK